MILDYTSQILLSNMKTIITPWGHNFFSRNSVSYQRPEMKHDTLLVMCYIISIKYIIFGNSDQFKLILTLTWKILIRLTDLGNNYIQLKTYWMMLENSILAHQGSNRC